MKNSIYYSTISELPIFNFSTVSKKGDLNYLLKIDPSELPKDKKKELSKLDLNELWISLYDEFIECVGLGDDFEKWMRLKVEAAKLYKKCYIDGDRSCRTLARVKEADADEIMSNIEGPSLEETASLISEKLGFHVDVMTTSVKQFYAHRKIASSK